MLGKSSIIFTLSYGEFEMKSEKTNSRKGNAQKPVTVIRNGAIAASIWRRQTSTGFEYLDFSLSRSWKLKSGDKEGYSANFFDNNADALIEVVERASQFIKTEMPSLRETANNTPDTSGENL